MTKRGIHICSFSKGERVLTLPDGQTFRFDWSDQFGPLFIGKSGREVQWRPASRSPFWDALQLWCQQGQYVNGEVCIYDVPPPDRFRHLGGKHYMADPSGDVMFPTALQKLAFSPSGARTT